MRSILVPVDDRPGSHRALETALNLARHTNGHVTVLIDTPVSNYISLDTMGGSYLVSDAFQAARDRSDESAETVEQRLSRGDVPFDIVRSEADQVNAVAEAGLLADLVVVSRASGLAGDVAMAARTPVLMLADNTPLPLPVRRACVAWDGGTQASVALRAAVPLLSGCQMVKVITVAEKTEGFPATDALRYLSRHGIHAELEECPRRGSTEETLAVAVAQAHAELLVMGAFGKNRLREWLFGGVTAHFLASESAPSLLIAH